MEDTFEWEMLTTLIKKVQNDKMLAQEEKNRRVTMLFDWWEKNGKKFKKIDNRVDKLKRKNKPVNFLLILKQFAFIHSLNRSYSGIETKILDKSHYTPEAIIKNINDDKLFLNNLITEINENNRRLQEFYKEWYEQ